MTSLSRLISRSESNPAPFHSLAKAETAYNLGIAARDRKNYGDAAQFFQGVHEILKGGDLTTTPTSFRRHSLIAAAHNYLGLIEIDRENWSGAIASFDQAVAVRRRMRQLFPTERENEVYLGGALVNRGTVTARLDPTAARGYFEESLAILRQPEPTCSCGYWDDQRQSWLCTPLEAMAQATGLAWIYLAPQFIDNAMRGLALLPDQER